MPSTDPFVAALQDWIAIFMRRSMRNVILYSKKSGLSMSQLGALFCIHRGPSSVSDLGDDLGITSAAASQMLERLVQQELILRSEDPHDRRVKQIVLTDKGRRILQESLQARQSWLDDLTGTLSASEKEQIMAALNILIDRANQLEQPPEPEP
ncbi:MAG: MarR family transcriptional regulator [Chloroflexi bacterium]|nr:MarR family transcriptional regulator [Chloroflexota bacterium]